MHFIPKWRQILFFFSLYNNLPSNARLQGKNYF